MKAEIFRNGINWFVNYYDSEENQIGTTDWISGFNDNPLKLAIERAKFWNCKSICIIF